TVEKISIDAQLNDQNQLFYVYKGKPLYIENAVAYNDSVIHPDRIVEYNSQAQTPQVTEQYIFETVQQDQGETQVYYQLRARRHWGFWSLMPALIAVLMCWLTKEPVTALLSGIICGAMIMGQYDITDGVIIERLADKDAAGVLLLYLWLLGGLMGIWSHTGAARAFAEFMTRHFVRGPRTAKLAAWFLGVIFFQGGSISCVLTGTTVKPFADKEKVSHEELSYIVDATGSPVASQLAFNAWPGYAQALIFVAGVPFLATEAQRIAFFFKSVPLSLYANLALILTLLLCFDKSPFMGSRLKAAWKRARETGKMDADDAEPLSSKELQTDNVPAGYQPHIVDFFIPLIALIAIAVGTFISSGSPQVRWAFGVAVVLAMGLALLRGMSLRQVMEGFLNGLKGVVLASLIL
ncbi:MAG: sodium:proton antiporter, partial [Planctomycetes bacterium]|nr:sodium:proton antiporter [Planctomycetota bacterium]